MANRKIRRRSRGQIIRRESNPSPKRKFNTRKRKIFYSALLQRLPLTRCAELAGITYQTYRQWMKKGNDIRHPVHRRFRFKVKQIGAQNEREALDIIRKAAGGGAKVVETKVVVGPRGAETTRIVKAALPIWQAAAWFLERRHRDDYGRDALPESMKKSAEEQAKEVKDALDALYKSVPLSDEDIEMPDDMPT